jgi:hypothetical protein
MDNSTNSAPTHTGSHTSQSDFNKSLNRILQHIKESQAASPADLLHTQDIFKLLHLIHHLGETHQGSPRDLHETLLEDQYKARSIDIAERITDIIYSIAITLQEWNTHLSTCKEYSCYTTNPLPTCQLRTGLHLFLTELSFLPVHIGSSDTTPGHPPTQRYRRLKTIIKEAFGKNIVNAIDSSIHHICEHIFLNPDKIPPGTPPNQWWWFEAANPSTNQQ